MGIMSDNPKQFEYLAIGGEVPHHGVLPQRAVEQYRSIQQYLTKEWRTSNESRQRWLWSINGCLDKLSTTLMQVARMRDHHDQLISHARELQKAPPEAHIALAAQEACGDFESLLLQGRAALDRLTWFLAAEFNQRCTRFSKLKKVLSNAGCQNPSAPILLNILDQALWLEGVFVDLGGLKALRSFVAHQGGISEAMDNCFGVSKVDTQTVLVYDCQSRNVPLLETSWQSAKFLSFVVLNSLSVVTKQTIHDLNCYDPLWDNLTVVPSQYIRPRDTGLSLPLITRMIPDGFDVRTCYVDPAILQKCVKQ